MATEDHRYDSHTQIAVPFPTFYVLPFLITFLPILLFSSLSRARFTICATIPLPTLLQIFPLPLVPSAVCAIPVVVILKPFFGQIQ